MNREEAKELAMVLEHWSNGGDIQGMHDCCDWVTIDGDKFFPEMGVKYRIKPRPHEYWARFDSEGNLVASRSKEWAPWKPSTDSGYVLMREVVEGIEE